MFRWYVINTYSGHENKVKHNLEHRVETMGQGRKVRQVVVPTEEVSEIKDGKKVNVEKRTMPGYVLVQMEMTDDAWGLVKNTPGVTGFVGSRNKPLPLSPAEVDNLLHTEAPVPAGATAGGGGGGARSPAAPAPSSAPSRGPSTRSARPSRSSPARSRTSAARSPRSTTTRPSSRSWSRSSAGRPRSRSATTRSRRSRQEGTTDRMAKKVLTLIKLQIPAGAANPAPPVGPALGQHGVNIMDFCKAFNAQTQQDSGTIIPVEITVFEDRSFTFITKTPPAAVLIKEAAGIQKGSAVPHTDKVGKITVDQARAIAERKMPDLNANDLDAATKIIAGTARSMGVDVEGL